MVFKTQQHNAGNFHSDEVWTKYSPPWRFSIDTNTPTSSPTIPNNNGFYTNLDRILGEASDPPNGSGLKKIEITIKKLNNNRFWDGSKWAPLETWLLASGTNMWE